MRALFQLIRSRTRTASAVSTPMDTSLPRKKTVVDQVRERDDKCRLTGVEREKSGPEGEDQRRRRAAMDTLQVVHCLPYKTGNTSFHLLEALAGVNFTGWQADSVENAFLARLSIHELFAAFKIFFEWTLTANGDVEIIIRGRTGPADPFFFLQTLRDDHGQPCDLIIGKPLRARHNTAIADIDEKFFVLHKYIGDIVWMSGGAEPVPDSDEDDDEGMKVLSNNNVGTVMEKLRSPEMDMLPRQREGIFHPIVELVPKQLVWAN
ncbi:hypothetical protein DFH06DRAFT_1197425 [Mycena polygramma]|nr:hypothetical protein DFH06DRAFT_1197425 [Mycena polygramma]